MEFLKKNIKRNYSRNGDIIGGASVKGNTITSPSSSINIDEIMGKFLPATNNGDGSYTVDLDKVNFKGNITAEGEVTAYKQGTESEGGTSGGNVVVYDGLDSSDPNIALSANQGRVLKGLIDSKADGGGGTANLENYYDKTTTDNKLNLKADKTWVTSNYQPKGNYLESIPSEYITETELNQTLQNKADKVHTHTAKDITNLDLTQYNNHISDTTKHITQAERNKWNGKLDKSVWDKAFYYDGNDLRVKVNLIGEKDVSAYGKGETSSGGVIDIADNLTTDAGNIALSARQGIVLKNLIDSKGTGGGNVDLTDYYKKKDVDALFQPKGNYLTTIPSEYITESELNQKGYLTQHQSLSNYYTRSEVNSHCWTVNDFSTTDKSNWNKAYNWGNHAVQGYLTQHQSLTHLAKKDGSNVSGTWNNLNAGSAERIAAFKHNEGNYLTFINGTRTDNTQNRALVDDGWRLKFTGTRPYYESSPLATINDEVAKSKETIKLNAVDNRSIGDKPRAKKQGVYADLKQNPTNGLKDGGSFNCALTIRGYGEAEDFTGGYPHQLAFTDNGNIWTRRAENADSWRSWNKIWHSGNFDPDTKVNKQGSFTIYTDDQKPYNYIHLFRIANKGTWSNIRVDIDFKSRYHAAKLYIDISTNDKTYGSGNSYLRISQLCANDRTAEFYVKQTVITPKPDEPTKGLYNYYDVYYKSGSWNSGSYGITNQGKNGDLVFEVFNKKLESLPQGTSKVLENLKINGNITATGEITAYSDKRLKSNIEPLENRGFIQPVTYTKDGKRSIGFLAQDVQEKYPELVYTDQSENKYLSLNYSQYTAVLQAQIIDQQKQIADLTEQIKAIQEQFKKNKK